MPLSDLAAKTAKVPEGKQQTKLSDGSGLYLLVKPAGKYWRMKYRFAGKEKTLALGTYPKVSLKEAREKRIEAQKLLGQNIDPSQHKQAQKRKAKALSQEDTFEAVAREYIEKQSKTWSAAHTEKQMRNLERGIFPWIGSMRLSTIEPLDVLTVAQRPEKLGKIETAHRYKRVCGQIFRYGIATGRAKSDPTRDLQDALTPIVTKHRATITDPIKVGQLLRDIDAFEGTFVVQCAFKISPYVFLRPGELRNGEWSEINFESETWKIPAHKMKPRAIHIVPLSKQVIQVLKDLYPLTGDGKYIFPSIRSATRPMSENTINTALRRIGYTKDEMCAHGFRATASTILHEQGWPSEVIEMQLSHQDSNAVRAAYNYAKHLPKRKKLMQHWADYLDELRVGENVIPINVNATA